MPPLQNPSEGHVDLANKGALQQLIKEESDKCILKTEEVKSSVGPTLERWKTAAEAELTNNFVKMGEFHESTPEEKKTFGRPLPMLCLVNSRGKELLQMSCVCFRELCRGGSYPTVLDSSGRTLVAVVCHQHGTTQRFDYVKGAFLNAKIPDGELLVVMPPDQWVRLGLVPPGTLWTLEKAVYDLRESPRLWSDERDKQLVLLEWTVG